MRNRGIKKTKKKQILIGRDSVAVPVDPNFEILLVGKETKKNVATIIRIFRHRSPCSDRVSLFDIKVDVASALSPRHLRYHELIPRAPFRSVKTYKVDARALCRAAKVLDRLCQGGTGNGL